MTSKWSWFPPFLIRGYGAVVHSWRKFPGGLGFEAHHNFPVHDQFVISCRYFMSRVFCSTLSHLPC